MAGQAAPRPARSAPRAERAATGTWPRWQRCSAAAAQCIPAPPAPSHCSPLQNLTLINVDHQAIARIDVRDPGGSELPPCSTAAPTRQGGGRGAAGAPALHPSMASALLGPGARCIEGPLIYPAPFPPQAPLACSTDGNQRCIDRPPISPLPSSPQTKYRLLPHVQLAGLRRLGHAAHGPHHRGLLALLVAARARLRVRGAGGGAAGMLLGGQVPWVAQRLAPRRSGRGARPAPSPGARPPILPSLLMPPYPCARPPPAPPPPSLQNEWNIWVCPWRGGQEVGRVELRIPGVTIAWDTGARPLLHGERQGCCGCRSCLPVAGAPVAPVAPEACRCCRRSGGLPAVRMASPPPVPPACPPLPHPPSPGLPLPLLQARRCLPPKTTRLAMWRCLATEETRCAPMPHAEWHLKPA